MYAIINHTYQRTGTLWEGRYKDSLIDSETYLLTCMRYIDKIERMSKRQVRPGQPGRPRVKEEQAVY
jgi:hypothetical protein